MAVLSYLDFFSTGVQRVAVSTASNICRQLPSDAGDLVMEVVPILTNILQYQDSKVVERACTCLTRISESFAVHPEKLDSLCSHGLIPQAVRLISVSNGASSQTPLSSSTLAGLFRLLATCAGGSPSAAERLLHLGISGTLRDILAGSVSTTSISTSALSRPAEQLYEIVSLVNELLPPLPDSTICLVGQAEVKHQRRRASIKGTEGGSTEEESGEKVSEVSVKEKLLMEEPDLLEGFGKDLFPVMMQVYGSSINPAVRYKCLAVISKLLHFSKPDILRPLLQDTSISSFLAGVLASKDAAILNSALQIADMLMVKLPDIFLKSLVKEGVVHAVDMLIGSEQSRASLSLPVASGKSLATPGAPPPRPRRGSSSRRRGGNQAQADATAAEDTHAHGSAVAAGSGQEATGGKTTRSNLKAEVFARAKQFHETYFSGSAGSAGAGITDSLQRLQELSSRLSNDPVLDVKLKTKGKSKAGAKAALVERNDETDMAVVLDILSALSEGEGVSTFEFIGSGVVDALLNYFSLGGAVTAGLDEENLKNVKAKVKDRLKRFVEMGFPVDDSNRARGAEIPMAVLVSKLQAALSSLERFPVVLSQVPRSTGGGLSVSAGLSALAQPFKLRLSRANSDKVLRDYSSNVVLIEPLATLAAVEDFLWPRVKRHEPSSGATGSSQPPESSAPCTGALPSGKDVVAMIPDAAEGAPGQPSSGEEERSLPRVWSLDPANKNSGASPSSSSHTLLPKGSCKPTSIGSSGAKGESAEKLEKLAQRTITMITRNAATAARLKAAESVNEVGEEVHPMEVDDENKDAGTSIEGFCEHPKSDGEGDEDMHSEDDDDDDDDEDEDEEDDDEDEEEEEVERDEENDEVFGGDAPPPCSGDRVHDVQLGGEGADAVTAVNTPVSAQTLSIPLEVHPMSRSSVTGTQAVEVMDVEPSATAAAWQRSEMRKSFAEAVLGSMVEPAVSSRSLGGAGSSLGDRRSMIAASLAAPPKLVFSLGNKTLDRSTTIFQAIQRHALGGEEEEERLGASEYVASFSGRRLWDEIYTITYKRPGGEGDEKNEAGPSRASEGANAGSAGKGPNHKNRETSWQRPSLVDVALAQNLPCDLDKNNTTYSILLLLHILERLNQSSGRLHAEARISQFARGTADTLQHARPGADVVPREEFMSSKLTPKLARQLQDALALCSGGLPPWCHQLTLACPFLFPFDTRRQYFYSTAFGLSRALQRLQQQQSAEGAPRSTDRELRELRVGRLQRQKVRVSRNRILDSAAKVMELYSGHKAVLEVEYFGEVGTGLGPTLEFYTLLSHELQRKHLKLWRMEGSEGNPGEQDIVRADVEREQGTGPVAEEQFDNVKKSGDADAFVNAPMGLFPRPWRSSADVSKDSLQGKVVEYFRLLGRVTGKALQDGRMLDLPFSPSFYKLVLGQELSLYDIKSFDRELGNTLEELQARVARKKWLEEEGCSSFSSIRLHGCPIEDLCLDFTLPGHPDYALKEGGGDINVTLDNLEEYIELVVDATVKSGIEAQMVAFRAGFNQVFDLSTLRIFSEDELDVILCGWKELWTPETLSEHIKFDHGYTAVSPPIRQLLEIMEELTPEEQRAFLRFVTGAPRLPPGGLGSLTPRLTIVRKHPSGSTGGTPPQGGGSGAVGTLADGDLPSVMTCANYLKLPPYSCKRVMKERLLYAINEGQGSFDLS